MRECLLIRAPYEKVTLNQTGRTFNWICGRWNQIEHGVETFEKELDAVKRYHEAQMICVTDYHFGLFMENIDEE